MFKRFGLGISSYFEAHSLIMKHKLWGYLLVPGIINIILFCFFIWGAFVFSDFVATEVTEMFGFKEKNTGFLAIIGDVVFLIISFIIKIILLVVYYAIYKYIILLLLSPILGALSERVERILTGKDFDTSVLQFVKDFARGIQLSLRNFLIEMFCVFLSFLLMYIPVVNLFIPLILFFVSSYFMGFSMIDYSNERHKMSITQSLGFMRNNKGMAIGNGFIFNLLFIIPFVGWIIAPGYAVVAATIATHKVKNNLV